MKIFGYQPDRGMLDEHPPFDEIAAPFFHRGGKTGCLVLHGIGGTPANVRPVADALAARGFTVFAPLLPGHGETVRALNDATAGQWLRCALSAYDRLRAAGCTAIVPVGLSLGGILSAHVAALRPCAGLVLISAPIRMRGYLRAARLMSPFVPFIRYSERDRQRTAALAPYAQMYNGFSTKKLCDLQRLIRRLRSRLPKITCPVLALWARYDNKVDPKSAAILRKGLCRAPLTERTLENSAHGSTYGEERALVASLVADFVENTAQHRSDAGGAGGTQGLFPDSAE